MNPGAGSTRNGTIPWFGMIKEIHYSSIDGIAPRFRIIGPPEVWNFPGKSKKVI
jgi:hypothetical protein